MSVLPNGTYLGEFEILDLIGEGGFGIVYLAYDHTLERHVALKEYMPSGLATRTPKMAVTVRSQHNASTFTAGLKSFINEAKLLAQFDSPALVKVYRFWEGNGTAYMVMPYYEGVTLKQALKDRQITPTESWLRLLLADLFDAIETIHQVQCFHRDIAPDNILLLKDGRPMLLDFDAARRVIGDLTQCLTVILKPGYAPIEQYADIAGLRQGAWTDIYALAAVVYYLITGKAPPPAVARVVHDEMIPAREAGKGRYSVQFLATLDKALAVKPEQRFKSIAELRQTLNIMETAPRTLPATISHRAAETAAAAPPVDGNPTAKQDKEPYLNANAYAHANSHPAADPYDRYDTSWMKKEEPPPRSKKPAWLMLGLLFSAGIASGMYWGMNGLPDTLPGQEYVASVIQPALGLATPESTPGNGTFQEAARVTPALSPDAATDAGVPPPLAGAQNTAPATVALDGTVKPAPAPEEAALASAATASGPSPEELSWQKASAADSASAYMRYLKEFPKGSHSAIARLRLEEKQSQTPETAAAEPVKTPPSLAGAAQAEAASDVAVPASAEPAVPEQRPVAATGPAEETLWKTALLLNQPSVYESYLNRYPTGRYAATAKEKLASVQAEEQTAVERASVEKTISERTTAQADTADRQPVREPNRAERTASIARDPQAVTRRAEAVTAPRPSEAEPEARPQRPSTTALASGGKTLQLDDQTMTGNFRVDPVSGIVSGTGRIVWANGHRFDGTLVRGVKEGQGEFVWNNGQRYAGEWSRDMPNGKGTIVFPNGNRYVGNVKDGIPHGEGVIRFKSGDVYRGNWVGGQSHGFGRYTWANGSYWEGQFRNDRRTENGKLVRAEDPAPASGSGSANAAAPDTQEVRSAGHAVAGEMSPGQ